MRGLGDLTLRERLLVLGGATLLVVVGAWLYLWQPILEAQRTETERIARYLTMVELARTTDSAPLLRNQPTVPDAPLAQRVTRSGEAADIPLARLDPDGSRLRVTVAEGDYAVLMSWIAMLEAQEAVRAVSVEMSRLTEPGSVSLRITLEDAL